MGKQNMPERPKDITKAAGLCPHGNFPDACLACRGQLGAKSAPEVSQPVDVESIIGRVKLLDDEAKTRLGEKKGRYFLIKVLDVFEAEGIYVRAAYDFCDKKARKFYANNLEKVQVVAQRLAIAEKRRRSIFQKPEDTRGSPFFLLEEISRFAEGRPTTLGIDLVNRLWESTESEEKFRLVSTELESQWFHEQVHGYTGSGDENATQLAEFLYDPAHNPRNDIFNRLSKQFGGYVKGAEIEDEARYVGAWLNVAKILLFEYKAREPSFTIPGTQSEQLELFLQLPTLYAQISEDERNKIIRKYVTPDLQQKHIYEEYKRIAADCASRLGLLL